MDSFVLLSSFFIGLILCKRIIGVFVFKYSLCGGILEGVSELRNLIGYKVCCFLLGILLVFKYVFVFFGKVGSLFIINLFILLIFLFVVVNIVFLK